MLEEARWFSPFYPSPDCCLRSFLAVTCRVAILTHPVHLVTTEIEIAMSSVNLQLISGKSSETWTESRRLATGATRTAIPGGRFGDKQKLPPCVNSCASVMILTCRDIHLSPAVKALSATPCARQDVTDGPSVLDYTQRTDDTEGVVPIVLNNQKGNAMFYGAGGFILLIIVILLLTGRL